MKRAIIASAALLASSLVPIDLPSFAAVASLPPPNVQVCPSPRPNLSSVFVSRFHWGDPYILTPSDDVITTYSDPVGDAFGVYVVATMDPPIVQRCVLQNSQNNVIGKDYDVRIETEQFYICFPPIVDDHLTLTHVGGVLGFTQADCDAYVFEDQGSGSSWHHR